MRRKYKNIYSDKFFNIIISAVISVSVIILCCLLFSFITFNFIENMKFSVFFSAASITAGSYAGSYICGKYRRRMGLVYGIINGIIIYSLISAANLIFLGNIPDIKKLLLLTFFSAAGGIAGVNSKRPSCLRD